MFYVAVDVVCRELVVRQNLEAPQRELAALNPFSVLPRAAKREFAVVMALDNAIVEEVAHLRDHVVGLLHHMISRRGDHGI